MKVLWTCLSACNETSSTCFQKKFEGTRVTIETFLAWKTKFDAERKELKRFQKDNDQLSKKPTGLKTHIIINIMSCSIMLQVQSCRRVCTHAPACTHTHTHTHTCTCTHTHTSLSLFCCLCF